MSVCQLGWGLLLSLVGIEAKEAAKYLIVHRTSPPLPQPTIKKAVKMSIMLK